MSVYVFPAILSKEADVYGVTFPDFPGCVSSGTSQTEIALNASEALSGHLEVLMDFGDRLPEPSDLENITLDSSQNEFAKILVTAYAAPVSGTVAAE